MTPRQAKAAINKAYDNVDKARQQVEKAEAAVRKAEREASAMVEVKRTSGSYTLTRKHDGLKVWMSATTEYPTVYWHENGKQTKNVAKGINAEPYFEFNWVKCVVIRLATYTK